MGRLVNAFQTKIVFLTLVFLTSICSQILYETNDQQYTILNRKSKDVSAKSILDETKVFLEKKTFSLQICIDAYYDLLIINSQRRTPSGKIIVFFLQKLCFSLFYNRWWGISILLLKFVIYIVRWYICNTSV